MYVQLFNLSRFKKESNIIGRIVNEYVKGSRPGTKVKLMSYYRARKLSTMSFTRVKESSRSSKLSVPIYASTC